MKKSNHQANVVKVEQVLPHNQADTLELVRIGEYQCVVKKDTFKSGDLAVYIQPDSVVPQTEPFRFIWGQYMCEPVTPMSPAEAADFVVPDRRRRITVRKFRGEWSEGLLLPVVDFPEFYTVIGPDRVKRFQSFTEGEDVSDLLGITHYDPDAGTENTRGDNEHAPNRKLRYPKTLKGWFFFLLHKLGYKQQRNETGVDLPVYDVDALKNYRNVLLPGELVIVTEKIHGSNGRFVYHHGKMYAGSRQFWKAPASNCVWRKALKQNPWIEEWCRAHEGYALYGEVTPTQKGFNYGCKEGEVKFFVFDVRTPNGQWADWKASWPDTYELLCFPTESSSRGLNLVPVLYTGPFDLEKIKSLVDGPSKVAGAKHVREGLVVKPQAERRVPGLGRVILKLVSNAFLEKDSK